MKKIVFAFFFLCVTLKMSAQITFLGFDQPFCPDPMTNTYTYTNYSSGSGSSAIYGYKIFRNGTLAYSDGGSMSGALTCYDLKFINDSTGFIVIQSGGGVTLRKTSNYGVSWVNSGSTAPSYLGLYVLNQYFAYLVCAQSPSSQVFVARCSDGVPCTICYYNI